MSGNSSATVATTRRTLSERGRSSAPAAPPAHELLGAELREVGLERAREPRALGRALLLPRVELPRSGAIATRQTEQRGLRDRVPCSAVVRRDRAPCRAGYSSSSEAAVASLE